MPTSLSIILIAFIIIWFTSDTIVRSVTTLSKQIRLSAFSTSFILLGILTSAPEFSIGVNAIADGIPEVFVGNLMGGIIVLFMFVAPFLAVIGNGIKMSHNVTSRGLLFVIVVVMVSALVPLRGYVDFVASIILIVLYCGLILFMREKKNLVEQIMNAINPRKRAANMYQVTKIVVGIIIIFFAGKLLVDNLVVIAGQLHVPPYLIALLGLSIGSNLPELFIGVLSVIRRQKEITFGHYLGSASANGFFMGLLTIINGKSVMVLDPFYFLIPLFLGTGLILFYQFTRSRNDLSRKEGGILLGLYCAFVITTLVCNSL